MTHRMSSKGLIGSILILLFVASLVVGSILASMEYNGKKQACISGGYESYSWRNSGCRDSEGNFHKKYFTCEGLINVTCKAGNYYG